jgi:hypothetical protein
MIQILHLMMIKVLITSVRKMQKRNKLLKFDHLVSLRGQSNCSLDLKVLPKDRPPSLVLEEQASVRIRQSKTPLKVALNPSSSLSLISPFPQIIRRGCSNRMERIHSHNNTINYYFRLLKDKTMAATPKKKL